MKSREVKNKDKLRIKTVRNIFFVYLFTSVASDRFGIFAAICASFPFIIPVIFFEEGSTSLQNAGKSLLYGVPGILAAVLFMLFTDSYSTAAWLIPAAYGFAMCLGFLAVKKSLSAQKLTVMKCIISVSVGFLAFMQK